MLLLVLVVLAALVGPPMGMAQVAEEGPFLWGGKRYFAEPPEVSSQILEKYEDIPARFPSARSCGYEPGDAADEGAWRVSLDQRAFEVCLFRILAKLESPAAIDRWLTGQGWMQRQIEDESHLARLYKADPPILQMVYGWDIDRLGMPFGPDLSRFDDWFTGPLATLEVIHGEKDGVLWVNVIVQGIWRK